MENDKYTVYKHTTPSGKVYIGITKNKASYRWGHDGNGYERQVFGRAVAKYGWENIRHEILFTDLTKSEAVEKEKHLISQYNSDNPIYGYNCTSGGCLCEFNEETKEKISKALTGRKLTDEHRMNIAKCRTGWIFSEETRRRIGEKHRNKTTTDTTKQRLRESHQWQAKQIAKMSLDGEILETFNSVGEAAKATGCSKLLIRRVCQGKRKTTNGFKWAFLEEGDC